MTASKSPASVFPFAIITFIYFIIGFLTTVNEQLQAPLRFTLLAHAGSLKNTLTTLISFFFFSGYLINGTLGSKWVNRFGYKNTILRGLGFTIAGLLMYFGSTFVSSSFPNLAFQLADALVPVGFLIFVLGSFLMGTSAAVVQVVVNPYVASYPLKGTQPVQRLNITTAINSIGTTSAPFFVTVVMFSGVSIDRIQIYQLLVPLTLLIVSILIVVLITSRLHIPDIENTRVLSGEKLERKIWSFRHFVLGVCAIFFYVGTEVSIGANINLYAFE